jgi:hypothetical protein
MPMLDNSQSPSTPNAPAVVVGDPNQRMTDGQSLPSQLAGRQGDQYVSEIHGKYYTQSYRGKTFIAGTGIAGSVIPLAPPVSQAQTALSLWNPAGSGKMIELIRLSIGAVSATTAVIGSFVWAADINQIQPTDTQRQSVDVSSNEPHRSKSDRASVGVELLLLRHLHHASRCLGLLHGAPHVRRSDRRTWPSTLDRLV